jgi:Leucine-rich repeat (LRR) protein
MFNVPTSDNGCAEFSDMLFSNNRITTIQPEIGRMDDIVNLTLDNNELTSLPDSICDLKYLKRLVLSDNRLTHLPSRLWTIQSLIYFVADRNDLETLPIESFNLAKMAAFSVNGNPKLKLMLDMLEAVVYRQATRRNQMHAWFELDEEWQHYDPPRIRYIDPE